MIQKLSSFIKSHPALSEEEKILWEKAIALFINDQHAEDVFEAVQNKGDLRFLTDNLKEKVKAIENKDTNAWGAILLKEDAFLDTLDD